MGWSVSADVAADDAHRSVSSVRGSLASSLRRLSTGYRIDASTDDGGSASAPHGLGSYAGRLNRAAREAEDGSCVVQAAEGALTEVDSILRRFRDLAVRASADDEHARTDLSTQASGLSGELGRIAASTTAAGTALLDGSVGRLTFMVGAGADEESAITVDLSGADVGAFADRLASAAPDLSSAAGARVAIATIDAQLIAVSATRAELGACRSRLGRTVACAHVAVENLSAAQCRTPDDDLAADLVTFAWAQILSQAGSAMLSQANSIPRGVFRLLQ